MRASPESVQGEVSLLLKDVTDTQPAAFIIAGKSYIEAKGYVKGCGDVRSGISYFGIHLHRENWIDGSDLADRILRLAVSAGGTGTKSQTGVSFSFPKNGTKVLYAEDELAFNSNTVYTVRFRMKAQTGETLPFRIAYTDGTRIPLTASETPDSDGFVNICFHSDPLKTLKGVDMYIRSSAEYVLDYSGFGIFHGTRDFSFFEPYEGVRHTVSYNAVLRDWNSLEDTVDLVSGILSPKTAFYRINGKSPQYPSEKRILLQEKLNVPLKEGETSFHVEGLTVVSTFEELENTNMSILLCDDRETLLISTRMFSSLNPAQSTAISLAAHVLYIPAYTTRKKLQFTSFTLMKGTQYLDIASSYRPAWVRVDYR